MQKLPADLQMPGAIKHYEKYIHRTRDNLFPICLCVVHVCTCTLQMVVSFYVGAENTNMKTRKCSHVAASWETETSHPPGESIETKRKQLTGADLAH